MNPMPLEVACLDRCVQFFQKMSHTNSLEAAHNYISDNYPSVVLSKLVRKLKYYRSDKLTLLFLPYLITSGKIYLTDSNLVETMFWLDTHPDLEAKLSSVHNLCINISGGANYFKLYNLLSKMNNLKFLTLNSCTTDEILAKVGICCKNLEIFDSRDDASSTVTDAGLAFISHCKNLRIVLFSNIADEYDYEDRFRFSSKGIAMLLFSLPKLQRLECPEYLLRDAFQFLYQMNFKNNSSTLRSVNLSFPGIPGTTVAILPYMCPNITTLSIYINEKEETAISTSLKRLLNLKKLQLSLEGRKSIQLLGFPNFGPRLQFLILRISTLSESDFAYLNKNCCKLEVFVLQMHSYNHDISVINFSSIPKFNEMHSLEIFSRISTRMFVILNRQVPYLKALYCPNASIDSFPAAIGAVIAEGCWLYLEVLVLPVLISYNIELIYSLLLALKNLKILAISFFNVSCEIKVKEFIAKYNLPVKICDQDDITLPSRRFDPVD